MVDLHPLHGGPDAQGVPAHDFSTNSNACGPCPAALTALSTADAAHYPDPTYRALRAALAQWHGVSIERVLVAASASEFIHRITAWRAIQPRRGAVPAGVLVPVQAYGDYARAAQVWGLPLVATPAQAQLVWCCDPSSPLGVDSDDGRAVLADLAPEAACVLDRAYEPLRLSGHSAHTPATLSRLWQLWTPNKALGLTGVRAAYVIAPDGAQLAVQTLQRQAPSWVLGAHGVALLQAWMQDEVQQWLNASRQTLRDWKEQQIELCQDLGWRVRPSVANYFVADLPRPLQASEVQHLRRQGIKLRDATSFGLPGAVRLGVLPPNAQQALLHAWRGLEQST